MGRRFWLVRPATAFETLNFPSIASAQAEPPGHGFYASREWRTLRYRVLRRSSGRCALCGHGSMHGALLHVDHIVPRSREPRLALVEGNLQVLCEDCNLGKGNSDSIDWR